VKLYRTNRGRNVRRLSKTGFFIQNHISEKIKFFPQIYLTSSYANIVQQEKLSNHYFINKFSIRPTAINFLRKSGIKFSAFSVTLPKSFFYE